MPVIKQLLLPILLVGCISHILADEGYQSITTQEHDKSITYYAGINPISLLSFLPNGIGTIATGFGIFSGQEFGISVYGGIHFAKVHSVEIRFSTGPADAIIWDTQLQCGYIWYPFEQFLNWDGGLGIGIMLRQFFWNNRITDYVTFNFTPEVILGWRFKMKTLAFDARAGWNFASTTWSTMPNTKVATGWTLFPYNLTLTTGIAWIF